MVGIVRLPIDIKRGMITPKGEGLNMNENKKCIPTIAVGVNEEKFADAMISEFGGDIVTKTTLMMGEEAAEVIKAYRVKHGLSKALKKATKSWVNNNPAPQSCFDALAKAGKDITKETKAQLRSEVKAEIEVKSNFDLHAKMHEIKIACKQRTENAVQTALKAIENKMVTFAIIKQVYAAMCVVAKTLVKEFKQFSHEDYQVDIKKALRVVSEGGARTLSIEGRLVFEGKFGIIKMAEQVLIDEIRDAKRLVFAKIHKGKVVTASVIDDLKHIKGQLHFATKERSGSMIRSLEKIAKRVGRRVRRTANTIVTAIKARGHLWQRA